MSREVPFQANSVKRAVRALQAAGLSVSGVKIERDGSFKLETAGKPAAANPCGANEWDAPE